MQELVKQAINTDVEAYWESGGKLNRGSFEAAMSVLLEQANKEERGVDDSSLVQAENMVRFSQIPITPEQRYLYAVLRGMTRETERGSDSPPEKPGTAPVWALTDQRLLAEVIRLTDETNLDPFMRAYPNIFRNDRKD